MSGTENPDYVLARELVRTRMNNAAHLNRENHYEKAIIAFH